MFRVVRGCSFLLLVLAAVGATKHAAAAPPWVGRSLTLPRHDWAFDVGMGLGHLDAPDSPTGLGMNLEGAVAVTGGLELGLRTGLRFDGDGRTTRADEYGRLFDRETFGTGNDGTANPEFRMRGALVQGRVVELGLEGRAVLPTEDQSRIAFVFGLPFWLRLGQSVRLDTGVYVPVAFYDPTLSAVSIPAHLWIQTSARLWLGPMAGVRFYRQGDWERTDYALGFGLGYGITQFLDFKALFFMPGVNHEAGARNYGAGVGIQVRIE